MSTVEDIEKAIERLQPNQLQQFRAWFEAYDSEIFDQRIAADVDSGALDAISEAERGAYRRGEASDL